MSTIQYQQLSVSWRAIVKAIAVVILTISSTIFAVAVAPLDRVHAASGLSRSEPAANDILKTAPTELKLWFTSPVTAKLSSIQLLNQAGRPVAGCSAAFLDATDPTLLKATLAPDTPLADGAYTILWRAYATEDGQVTSGVIPFAIGTDREAAIAALNALQTPQTAASSAATTTSADPISVLFRWLNYLGLALLLGGFAFVPLALRPAISMANTQPDPNAVPDSDSESQRPSVAILSVLRVGLVVTAITTVIAAVLQALRLETGLAPGEALDALVTTTRYGALYWGRLILLMGLSLPIFVRPAWLSRRWMWWVGVAGSALILLTISVSNKAALFASPLLPIVADWLHLVSAGIWTGGLILMGIAFARAVRLEPAFRGRYLSALVTQFASITTLALLMLGLTGVYRAVSEIAYVTNLLDTSYGIALLVKVALVIPLIGLTVWNGRLLRRAFAVNGSLTAKAARFNGQLVLVMGALLVTSILAGLPSSRTAFGSGEITRGSVGDYRAIMTADPGQPGLNTFRVALRDALGRPVSDAQEVVLVFSMASHAMGEQGTVLTNDGEGNYSAQGGFISMWGSWDVQLRVKSASGSDAGTTMVFAPPYPTSSTAGAASSGSLSGSSADNATSTSASPLVMRVLLGVEAVIAGIALWMIARRSARTMAIMPFARRMMVAGSLALLVFGVGYVATVPSDPTVLASTIKNPIAPDAESIKRGRDLYEQNCLPCHGTTGVGDGPVGLSLNPKPANLQIHMAAGHLDGDLFLWIGKGIPGSAMPAFEDRLSETQRWDVINYVRTFSSFLPTPAPLPTAQK